MSVETEELEGNDMFVIVDADIDVGIMGSDHCPVVATLSCVVPCVNTDRNPTPPSMCTCHIPGYMKKQLGMSGFLAPVGAVVPVCFPSPSPQDISSQFSQPSGLSGLSVLSKATATKRKRVQERQSQSQSQSKSGGRQVCLTLTGMTGKKPAGQSIWSCSVCTYDNTIEMGVGIGIGVGIGVSALRCGMCNTIKSPSTTPPEEVQHDHNPTSPSISSPNSNPSIGSKPHQGTYTHTLTNTLTNNTSGVPPAPSKSTNAFKLLKASQKQIVVPLCSQHNIPCTVQVVLKDGPNKGKR